jgi:hypothetical protein
MKFLGRLLLLYSWPLSSCSSSWNIPFNLMAVLRQEQSQLNRGHSLEQVTPILFNGTPLWFNTSMTVVGTIMCQTLKPSRIHNPYTRGSPWLINGDPWNWSEGRATSRERHNVSNQVWDLLYSCLCYQSSFCTPWSSLIWPLSATFSSLAKSRKA